MDRGRRTLELPARIEENRMSNGIGSVGVLFVVIQGQEENHMF